MAVIVRQTGYNVFVLSFGGFLKCTIKQNIMARVGLVSNVYLCHLYYPLFINPTTDFYKILLLGEHISYLSPH